MPTQFPQPGPQGGERPPVQIPEATRPTEVQPIHVPTPPESHAQPVQAQEVAPLEQPGLKEQEIVEQLDDAAADVATEAATDPELDQVQALLDAGNDPVDLETAFAGQDTPEI
jgi:hypothetical protein